MKADVSILIPVYNGEKWLSACLESAVAVTAASEIIICDDGSKDKSVSIAEGFAKKDKRIRVYRNPKNLGLVGNWNRCMELATSEWIKFLFQDDRLQNGSVEKMLEAASSSVQLIAAKRNYVFTAHSSSESKEYYTKHVLTLDKLPASERDSMYYTSVQISTYAAAHIARNFIGEPSTVMFRRSLIEQIGKFDPEFRQICDLEYWLRIAGVHGLVYVPDAVIDFTVHDDSVSAQNAAQKKSGFDAILLVDRMLHAEDYRGMRKNFSTSELKKLLLWLRVQTYELRIKAPAAAAQFFNTHPQLKTISEKFGNGLLYRLARLRRR
jgi:glycosyltransferase involved in cell wall biosynthesis